MLLKFLSRISKSLTHALNESVAEAEQKVTALTPNPFLDTGAQTLKWAWEREVPKSTGWIQTNEPIGYLIPLWL